MTCRICFADIDAKAIVCYRCGAPTADPGEVRPTETAGGARWIWGLAILLVVLAVAGYLWLIR